LDLDLPNLESLQLDNNEIEVIPREIDRLVSLEELVLDNNRISQIPDNLHSGHMKALSYLVLEHNPLSPADIPISVLTDSVRGCC
jgi:Leucine-rich repeat (LRR) protein